jgi:hypothetical protein
MYISRRLEDESGTPAGRKVGKPQVLQTVKGAWLSIDGIFSSAQASFVTEGDGKLSELKGENP